MNRIRVSKESIRKSIGRKRIPRSWSLFISGGALYDILSMNGKIDKYHLMSKDYNIRVKELDSNTMLLMGKF